MRKNYSEAMQAEQARNQLVECGTQLAESEKWRGFCESISDPIMRSFTAIMLEQQKQYMDRLDEATYQASIGSWDKFAFPIIRTLIPNLSANGLVSIQPMTGPTSLVFMMKYVFGSNKGRVQRGTEAFENIDSSYSSEEVPGEVIGNGNGVLVQFTGNLQMLPVRPSSIVITAIVAAATVTITDDGNGNLIGAVDGGGNNTIDYNTGAFDFTTTAAVDDTTEILVTYNYNSEGNSNIPEMELQLTSSPVAAAVRKLKIKWSMEAMQALMAYHGIDAETELTSIVSEEMRVEIDRSILLDLWNLGNYWQVPAVGDRWSIVPDTGLSVQEHYNSFVAHLNREALTMFNVTKKAMPNWIVCGTEVGAVITSITGFNGSDPMGKSGVLPLGNLRGKWDIYVDPLMEPTQYLMGWKGPSWLYAGYAYMPWIPMYQTPTVMLDDFVGRKGFASQAASKMIEKKYYKRGQIKLTA